MVGYSKVNNIRSDADGAIFVKAEHSTNRGAGEVVDDVVVAHNTLAVVPNGAQRNVFIRFVKPGDRNDPHIRIKRLRLLNNLIANQNAAVPAVGVFLEQLTNPTVTWDTAITPGGANSANWVVAGNAWTVQPAARFAWDIPAGAPNRTLEQWKAKTAAATDEDVVVTVPLDTFIPALGAEPHLEFSARVSEAWWDLNGAVRTVTAGNVTAGAVTRN